MERRENAVAVVVPTRDRPSLVGAALESVLGQTHPPAEVVVVDDGSEPPLVLAPSIAHDPRVRLLRTRGVGPAAARNVGVRTTTAPLLAFCDDDDRWAPQKLARQVALLCEDPSADAAYCGYEVVGAEGAVLQVHHPVPEVELPLALLLDPAVQTSTLVVRRTAFDAVGGFDESVDHLNDWLLSIRLLDRYRIAALDELLVCRTPSTAGDATGLKARRVFAALTASHRARLSSAERRRVDAHQRFSEGVYLARLGRRGAAARALVASWRARPSARAAVHMLRLVTGERMWEAARRLRLRWRRLGARIRGARRRAGRGR